MASGMTEVGSRPFPALTPVQRLHLEVEGYVVIESLLSREEVATLLDTIYGIESKYRETGELPGPDSHLSRTSEEYFRIDNLPHLAPCLFDYVTNPRIVGMAEEIVGGRVRLEQSDAHIRSQQLDEPNEYSFHRGLEAGYGDTREGLYHFSFVKALTNLTDLGPDDGGTTVIAGTHKIPAEREQAIIDAAMAEPGLIRQVEAPAGSTLLFFESLMHSHGIIESEKERVFLVAGYMPTMFQTWRGYEPSAEFVETLSTEHRALLTGESKADWKPRVRRLDQTTE